MAHPDDLAYPLFKVALEKYGSSIDKLDEYKRDDVQRIALRTRRIEEAVLSSKESAKVVVRDAEVKQTLAEIKHRFDNAAAFVSALNYAGIDEQEFYKALVRELHVDAVLNYVSSQTAPISDTDASLFYYMNIAKFELPEVRTARHILITINEENNENTRELSYKKIRQVHARLQKKSDRFEEQALKHSECPTALQGGVLGKVKRNVLYPEIEQVLFALKVGQLSDIVESPLGFHIIRCDDIEGGGIAPLRKVMAKLKEHLVQTNQKQMQRQWLESQLRNTATDETYLSGEIVNG